MRRVQEAAENARNGYGTRFLGFLDERGCVLAEACLHKETDVFATFWGGFEEAQRCYLGLSGEAAPAAEEFPLTCLQLKCWLPGRCIPANALPTHRDYLGALLGLGLKRECLGDIMTQDDFALCFAEEKTARVILQELTSVGRFTVQAEPAAAEILQNWKPKTETLTLNVPSLRADAVLAALLHCSRTQAAGLIQGGAVSLCHVPLSQLHASVEEGDVFSVRGHGRFCVREIGGLSKKGRIWVTADRFTG